MVNSSRCNIIRNVEWRVAPINEVGEIFIRFRNIICYIHKEGGTIIMGVIESAIHTIRNVEWRAAPINEVEEVWTVRNLKLRRILVLLDLRSVN